MVVIGGNGPEVHLHEKVNLANLRIWMVVQRKTKTVRLREASTISQG